MLTPDLLRQLQLKVDDLTKRIDLATAELLSLSAQFGEAAFMGNFEETERIRDVLLAKQGDVLDGICAKSKLLRQMRGK
jgi:hypothetical protein